MPVIFVSLVIGMNFSRVILMESFDVHLKEFISLCKCHRF